MKKVKVCHLTSAHPVNDIRIFFKECISLKNAGYDVYLIVNGEENRTQEDINIIGTKKIENRFFRIFVSPILILFKALKVSQTKKLIKEIYSKKSRNKFFASS